MNPDRLAKYELYLTAWSPLSDDERAKVLAATLLPDVAYRDAMTSLGTGEDLAAHLSAFQGRLPGCRFRLLSLLDWGEDSLAHWQLMDAAGAPGFVGWDAITWSGDRMASIVGFSDTERQRLR